MSTFSIITQGGVSVLLQNGAVVARVPESLGSGYSPTAGTMAIRDIIREVETDYPRAPQRTREAHIRQRLRKLAASEPLRYHAQLVDCYSPSLLGSTEREHRSGPTAADLEAAARNVLRSGAAATNVLGRAKIWLSDLYERFASRMSRAEFNELLRRLRRSGEIQLSRCDMPEAFPRPADRKKLAESEFEYIPDNYGSTLHFFLLET